MGETCATTLDRAAFGQALAEAARHLDHRRPALERLGAARTVCLYGYGTVAVMVAPQFQRLGLEVVISDTSEASRARARAAGYTVVEPAEARRLPMVITAAQNQLAIRADFPEAFSHAEGLYAFGLPASCAERAGDYTDGLAEDHDAYYLAYTLIDPASQAAYLDVLRYRASLDPAMLAPTKRPLREMWLMPFGQVPIASVCDGGAYDGDSLEAFAAVCDTITRALTIEPSPRLAPEVAAVAARLGWELDHVVGGLWDYETRLREAKTYLGMIRVEPAPDGEIAAFALDDLARGRTYDLVKLDIEGSELRAIEGGQRTLAGARALAIASYHLPEHLAAVPTRIERLLREAAPERPRRLHFGHYSEIIDDSILYAW